MFRARVFIIRMSKLHYTASGIIKPIGSRPVHETASSWLIAEIKENLFLSYQSKVDVRIMQSDFYIEEAVMELC